MYFRLANGSVKATTKQPVHKDFNRVEVTSIEANQFRYTNLSVNIINPDTHFQRKTYNGELRLAMTPVKRGDSLNRYRGFYANVIEIPPLLPGLNSISVTDFTGWKRNNVSERRFYNPPPVRDGMPWEPDSSVSRNVRGYLYRLVRDSNHIRQGHLIRGFDVETGELTIVKDNVNIFIVKWKGPIGYKHIRFLKYIGEFETYLTYSIN